MESLRPHIIDMYDWINKMRKDIEQIKKDIQYIKRTV